MTAQEAARQRREEWFHEARSRLDERFAAEGSPPATDADWRLVRARHAADFMFMPGQEDDLAEIAYGLVTFSRQRARLEGQGPAFSTSLAGFLTSVTPPAWWVDASRAAIGPSSEQIRVLLRAALGLWGPPDAPDSLASPTIPPSADWVRAVMGAITEERERGLDYARPMALDQVRSFLLERAEAQQREGPLRMLRYPTNMEDREARIAPITFLPGKQAFTVGEMGVFAGPEPLSVGSSPEEATKPHPVLDVLRLQAEVEAALLGVDAAEVTAWVLCDYELVAPWIDIRVAPNLRRGLGKRQDLRLAIDVGSLLVTPEALASAYAGFRAAWLGTDGAASLPKPPDDWDVLHVRFMEEWKAAHDPIDWKGAWAEWQSRYPNSKWKVFRSFRNAHYQGKGAKP